MIRVLLAGVPFEPWFPEAAVPSGLTRVFDFESGLRQARVIGPGVFAVSGDVAVVLPRCYEGVADEADRFAAIGHTLRVLRRYLGEASTRRAVVEADLNIAPATAGDAVALMEILEASLLLWEDFRTNGPLAVATRTESTDARGRINWPRTIATRLPLVSGVDVIYHDPARTRHALSPLHPITRLHAMTAKVAGHFLGELRGFHEGRTSVREALKVLDRYEHALSSDRHRRVATLLRRYYSVSRRPASPRGPQQAASGIVAPSFPHVWERMLFVALGSDPIPVLPNGQYLRCESGARQAGASFRLDLLLQALHEGQPTLIVLDAKDYAPGALPAADAINKQLLYRLLLSSSSLVKDGATRPLPLRYIGNAFVGPAFLRVDPWLRIQALHDFVGEENLAAPFGRIVSIEADFPRVASAYARGLADTRVREGVISAVMGAMLHGGSQWEQSQSTPPAGPRSGGPS